MIELGKWNDLLVARRVSFGAYLGKTKDAPEAERILLPENQVPEGLAEGDLISAFVYRDSEDRLIATLKEPAMTLGGIAKLTVTDVTRVGAFLDWGLEKDLFLPFREQTKKVAKGDVVLAALYIDKSGRLAATMNVYPYLKSRSPYLAGQTVTGTVYETSDNYGLFVAVDNAYSALIPKKELAGSAVSIGDEVICRISRLRPDGKLELSLRDKAYKAMKSDSEAVLAKIREDYEGELPFDDKASPEKIKEVFGLSKAAFKRAVGQLYRERKIALKDGTIRVL